MTRKYVRGRHMLWYRSETVPTPTHSIRLDETVPELEQDAKLVNQSNTHFMLC